MPPLDCNYRQIKMTEQPYDILHYTNPNFSSQHKPVVLSLREYLFDQNLIDSPNCACGNIESTSHYLLRCIRCTQLRYNTFSTLPFSDYFWLTHSTSRLCWSFRWQNKLLFYMSISISLTANGSFDMHFNFQLKFLIYSISLLTICFVPLFFYPSYYIMCSLLNLVSSVFHTTPTLTIYFWQFIILVTSSTEHQTMLYDIIIVKLYMEMD